MFDFSNENIVLIGAMLLFVAVVAGKAAYRFGAPALLLFLGVGMLFGLDFITYRSLEVTQFVGMTALCIILFTGGMDTKFSQIRPVIGPGVVLATAGVIVTAFVLGGFVWLVAPAVGVELPFMTALLLAATMASTDSASVFSILRSKNQGLRQNLRPLLELESGSNDPMAYMLTILLVGALSHSSGGVGWGLSVVLFVVQMVVGALSGYFVGRLAVWTINRINLANRSLYSVLLLAFIFFAFAFTDLIRGNGYLAVYIGGLVVGNRKLTQKQPMTIFFDGFTWLMQIVMFLMLGLFVNSDELLQPKVLVLGIAVGVFMILVARPVPQIHGQGALVCFMGRTARSRADSVRTLSVARQDGICRFAVQCGFSVDDHLFVGAGHDRQRHGQSVGPFLRRTRIDFQREHAGGGKVRIYGGRSQRGYAR